MEKKITTLMNLNRKIHHHLIQNTKRKVQSRVKHDRFQHMTERQIEAIITIHHMAPCTLTDLARELDITLPSASSLVDSFVNQGYVIRKTNPKDRRQIAISLEPDMKKFVDLAKRTLTETFMELSQRIGQELFDEWLNIVSKINDIINSSGNSQRK